ncbi:MAG: Eco57I restriction-modification methylase domain-containing protein, partial [Schwartzia sp.]|nr:Eco57I restriction-modification methylase domain-containing protein [Schwartzia sp. (in: firmicutes)]
MGTQNQRYGAIGDLKSIEHTRRFLQKTIDESKGMEERRRYGQFATPYPLAKEIVSYGMTLMPHHGITFLDPCIGSGAFYSALLGVIDADHEIQRATGIEIDAAYYDCAGNLWGNTEIELIHDDFVRVEPQRRYNFLIANPPYVRHHCIQQGEKAVLFEKEKNETGISLSGLAGLYCHFMLLAHKWLAPDAICGWLVPSEFMDVNYGTAIKEYLLHRVHLLRIHRYDPKNPLFSEALVSSCVVWFKNEASDTDYEIEFSFGGTHTAPINSKKIKKSDLMKERKWTRFPEKGIRKDNTVGGTLGDFFFIKRGLATGDNNYFIKKLEKNAPK